MNNRATPTLLSFPEESGGKNSGRCTVSSKSSWIGCGTQCSVRISQGSGGGGGGSVCVWGDGRSGQLCVPLGMSSVPLTVPLLSNVFQCSVGNGHLVTLSKVQGTEKTKVHAWGNNGEEGIEQQTEEELQPNEILIGHDLVTISNVAAGTCQVWASCCVLVSSSSCFLGVSSSLQLILIIFFGYFSFYLFPLSSFFFFLPFSFVSRFRTRASINNDRFSVCMGK